MADNHKTDCRLEQPTNDENPVFLPIFVYRLGAWIEARYPTMNRFIKTGSTIFRMNIVVWDATHAIRLRRNEVNCTFYSPFSPSPAPALSPALLIEFGVGNPPALPTDIPAALSNRYSEFPERLLETDKEFFEIIASCYTSPASRETLNQICNGSGLLLLQHLHHSRSLSWAPSLTSP